MYPLPPLLLLISSLSSPFAYSYSYSYRYTYPSLFLISQFTSTFQLSMRCDYSTYHAFKVTLTIISPNPMRIYKQLIATPQALTGLYLRSYYIYILQLRGCRRKPWVVDNHTCAGGGERGWNIVLKTQSNGNVEMLIRDCEKELRCFCNTCLLYTSPSPRD